MGGLLGSFLLLADATLRLCCQAESQEWVASALRVSARRCRTPILGIDTPLSIFLRKEVGSAVALDSSKTESLALSRRRRSSEPSVVLGKNFS